MRRYLLIISAAVFGILIIATEWLTPLASILAASVGGLGFVVLALSLVFGLFNLIVDRTWPRDCLRASFAGLIMIVWSFAIVWGCNLTDSLGFHFAKDYPMQVGTALEEFHQQHGHYPDSLAEIPSLPRCPQRVSYCAIRGKYIFSYAIGGIFSEYQYSSDRKSWVFIAD